MNRQITLRHAEYFAAVAESGSMTAASLGLHVSQSAVSLAVAELEKIAGASLFQRRHAKGLLLTETGSELLPIAKELLRKADEFQTLLATAGTDVAGRLVIGCLSAVSSSYLPRLLDSFRLAFPSVDLVFMEGNSQQLHELLLTGACEAALLFELDMPYTLKTELVRRITPYALVSGDNPLAKRKELSLSDLDTEPMIHFELSPGEPYFRRVFAQVGLYPRIKYNTANLELVRSLVERDLGYSLLAEDLPPDTAKLRHLRLAGSPLPVSLVVAYPGGMRLSRRAAAFVDHVHSTLGE